MTGVPNSKPTVYHTNLFTIDNNEALHVNECFVCHPVYLDLKHWHLVCKRVTYKNV